MVYSLRSSPFSFEANRSVYMKLSDFRPAQITSLLQDLKAEATGFVRTCDAESEILSEFKVYMRYTGQGCEIPITLTEDQAMNPDADTFQARFEEDYTKLFGRPVAGLDVEITVWSVNATTPPEPVAPATLATELKNAVINGKCTVFDPAKDKFVPGYRYDRHKLEPGRLIRHSGKITEAETTIIIPSSRQAVIQHDGCVDLTRKEETE